MVPGARTPWINVPLQTLIKLPPKAYGTDKEGCEANIPAFIALWAKGSAEKHGNPAPESL